MGMWILHYQEQDVPEDLYAIQETLETLKYIVKGWKFPEEVSIARHSK